MTQPSGMAANSQLREALARIAYDRGDIRLVDPDLAGWDWLATTHRGLFAVANDRIKLVLHGWYFGLCRHRDQLFVFENCGHRDFDSNRSRLLRFDIAGDTLTDPRILVTGLHNNCHQVAVIDETLCLVDTANQAIRRYTLDGDLVDVRHPFPIAPPDDRSGNYVHVNTIAKVGDRIGLVLHNGKALPEKNSEVAWLDTGWTVVERYSLPGHHCHDLVEDGHGRLWHSLSREGDIMRSDGTIVRITDDKMARGIALMPDTMAVGISTFGPRHLRGTLNGHVVLLDRTTLRQTHDMKMPAAPADIIAIRC